MIELDDAITDHPIALTCRGCSASSTSARIEAHADGGYMLRARHSGKVIDVHGASGLSGEGAGSVGAPEHAVGALDLPPTGQRNLADNVWALLGGVARGRFDVRPHDPGRACRYCAFGPVCRVERGDELDEEGS